MAENTNAYIKQLLETVYSGALELKGASTITAKVDDRAKVKSDLYAFLDKQKYVYIDEKTTKSSFNVTKIKTPDGKMVTIVWKNQKGGGSGAGAEMTAIAESAQCWYSAVAFNASLNSQDDFLKHVQNSSISSKCQTDITLATITEKLPDDWIDSSIKIANYMRDSIPNFKQKQKQYTFHRGSALVDKINAVFTAVNRTEKAFANINKWNPADIWLMTDAGKNAVTSLNAKTMAELNEFIMKHYNSGDLIGVSLKKVGAQPHYEIFNAVKNTSITKFKSFKVSTASKDGYILFSYKDDPNMSIQFRSFSDTGSWQGEIKGKYAAGGKIGGGQVASIFNRVTNKTLSSSNANNITKRVKDGDRKINTELAAYAKSIRVDISEGEIVLKANDWKYSKYLTLEAFSIFNALTDEKKSKILNEIVGYAASSTDLSSVFIKIS